VISNLNLQQVLADQEEKGSAKLPLDVAYLILSRKVGVDQTRGTSLIEITVRNPSYDVASDIANNVAEVYKQYRMESWTGPHTGGIETLKTALATNEASCTPSKQISTRFAPR
jgi:capsular polysaccharide biosynthesis protein